MTEPDEIEVIDKHNNKPLSDQAYMILKKRIMSEKSGAYISARQFATEVGISYTPVREAFLRLQKEGALKLVPNVGFFVQSLDLPDLLQILEVREAIETFVWDKVFDLLGSESLEKMKKLVIEQREAVTSGDAFQYQQADKKMHEIPFRIYGNLPLLRFYQNIREQYMICSKQVATARGEESTEEHEEIIRCLESRDKDGVISGLKRHISETKKRMAEGYINLTSNSSY